MNGKEVRDMQDEALKLELLKARNALYDLNSKSVTAKVDDTSKFKKLRQDIARMLGEQTRRVSAAK